MFYLIKNKSGMYSPLDESDFETSKLVGIGTVVRATAARNFKFLKKAMALLKIGFDSQDTYESFEVYRKIITIRAGFYDETADKDGEAFYLPKSLAFDKMSHEDFSKWYDATLLVLSQDMETAPEQIRNEIDSFF